jgi:hypothetical protein
VEHTARNGANARVAHGKIGAECNLVTDDPEAGGQDPERSFLASVGVVSSQLS